jgi:hypothetical protein
MVLPRPATGAAGLVGRLFVVPAGAQPVPVSDGYIGLCRARFSPAGAGQSTGKTGSTHLLPISPGERCLGGGGGHGVKVLKPMRFSPDRCGGKPCAAREPMWHAAAGGLYRIRKWPIKRHLRTIRPQSRGVKMLY